MGETPDTTARGGMTHERRQNTTERGTRGVVASDGRGSPRRLPRDRRGRSGLVDLVRRASAGKRHRAVARRKTVEERPDLLAGTGRQAADERGTRSALGELLRQLLRQPLPEVASAPRTSHE